MRSDDPAATQVRAVVLLLGRRIVDEAERWLLSVPREANYDMLLDCNGRAVVDEQNLRAGPIALEPALDVLVDVVDQLRVSEVVVTWARSMSEVFWGLSTMSNPGARASRS